MLETLPDGPATTRKAPAKSDVLRPAAWVLPNGAPGLPLTTCRMDVPSHGRLVAWTRKKLGRENDDVTVILRGLHELVAYFVPETAFITVRPGGREGPACLGLTFAGRRKGDADLKARLLPALVRWLAINFDKENAAERMEVARSMLADTQWKEADVSPDWTWNGGATCPEPSDPDLWNALTAHAVAALAGKRIAFRGGGEDRWLVPTRPGPNGNTYEGIELVAFPPSRGDDGGYHSEVVTVTTATYPERGGIHLVMRVSMRSWGKPEGWRADLGRTLDVFMPALGGTGEYGTWRHSAFECERKGSERGKIPGESTERWVWRHDQSKQVMGVLAGLNGLDYVREDAPVAPMEVAGSYLILPRLGTVHGDDNLSGGSGLGWRDRHDFVRALSPHLESLGLVPAGAMVRVDRRGLNKAVDDVFGKASRPKEVVPPKDLADGAGAQEAQAHAEAMAKYEKAKVNYDRRQERFEVESPRKAGLRRASLRAALRALPGSGATTLEFFVLTADDAAPARVAWHLRDALGDTTGGSEEELVWNDGNETLRIVLRVAHPGTLATQMEWAEAPAEEVGGLTEAQRREANRRARQSYHRDVERQMTAEVAAARRGGTDVACAILEMAEELQRKQGQDPYTLAKRTLARANILVQPFLVPTERGELSEKAREMRRKEADNKYAMCVRDCLRMLGVSTVAEYHPAGLAPAALCVIQKNRKRRGGTLVQGQAVPLAALVRDGSLHVALPDGTTGEPRWLPYAMAILRIMSGEYDALERSQSADNRRLFHNFFAQVLRRIAASGPALVIADQGGTTRWIDTLQNGKLAWDELKAGNTMFRPDMLPGLRVVRTNAVAAKLPQYVQELDPEGDTEVNQWPSGLFVWRSGEPGNAGRTAFSLKAKPHTAQKAAEAMMGSRHGRAGANEGVDDGARRASAQLEELCAVFLQPEDLAEPLRLIDLADRWRHLHVAYGGETRLPFPLHELRLLEGAIVGAPE